VIFRCIAAPDAQFFGSQSIQGVLKNSQDVSGAQGYEPSDGRNFNNLQDAGGAQSHCKEGRGTDIGQLSDSGGIRFSRLSQKLVYDRRTVLSRQPQQQRTDVAAETA